MANVEMMDEPTMSDAEIMDALDADISEYMRMVLEARGVEWTAENVTALVFEVQDRIDARKRMLDDEISAARRRVAGATLA